MTTKNTDFFDKALRYHNINKREFAKYSQIPYDTVAGWKRTGHVPNYAFVLLKTMAFERRTGKVNIFLSQNAIKMPIDDKLAKKILVAFWGKNYTVDQIIKEVEKGNPAFVKPFFENIFYGDILKIMPIKKIEKLLVVLKEIFKSDTVNFWAYVVNLYKTKVIQYA